MLKAISELDGKTRKQTQSSTSPRELVLGDLIQSITFKSPWKDLPAELAAGVLQGLECRKLFVLTFWIGMSSRANIYVRSVDACTAGHFLMVEMHAFTKYMKLNRAVYIIKD